MRTLLSPRHFLLALAVVAVWGTNFVVIKLALGQMPPLLFATLRFLVVVLPMVKNTWVWITKEARPGEI